jgi:hypothetical protein
LIPPYWYGHKMNGMVSMTREDIVRMAKEAGFYIEHNEIYSMSTQSDHELTEPIERFAELVAQHERKEMQAKIETLYAMYEVAVKQRDYLMDQQRAQIEAMRGRVQ